MIKLLKILKEEFRGGKFQLPPDHKPFEYSPEGFSCAKCKYLIKDGDYNKCINRYFKEWSGSDIIPGDPNHFCSDWFVKK